MFKRITEIALLLILSVLLFPLYALVSAAVDFLLGGLALQDTLKFESHRVFFDQFLAAWMASLPVFTVLFLLVYWPLSVILRRLRFPCFGIFLTSVVIAGTGIGVFLYGMAPVPLLSLLLSSMLLAAVHAVGFCRRLD